MAKVSKKQAKLNRDTRGMRRDPIEKFQVLCDCGCGSPATDCHELTSGFSRPEAMKDPRLLMYLARGCHERIQGMPYAKQIAIVARAMVRSVNRVRACNAVSDDKVVMYLQKS